MRHWKTRLLLPGLLLACVAATAGYWQWKQRPNRPAQTVRIVAAYPHDTDAFTQGLLIADGRLFESTGLYGHSTIREVDLETGEVLRSVNVRGSLFAEGMTMLDGRLYFVTWQEQSAYVLDPATFQVQDRFHYSGEGWGLTDDGTHLILSDGSATLRFLDPQTFRVVRRITVHEGRRRIENLNELEFIDGEIYANIWKSPLIVRISPKTGAVLGWIDASNLWRHVRLAHPRVDVLNGIAYDSKRKAIYLTGKRWPKLFEVEIVGATETRRAGP